MKRLNLKLDCKVCGTIYLDVPNDSPIHCSNCNELVGTWGELQRDFYRQSGQGVFHLHDGQIDVLTSDDLSSLDRISGESLERDEAPCDSEAPRCLQSQEKR